MVTTRLHRLFPPCNRQRVITPGMNRVAILASSISVALLLAACGSSSPSQQASANKNAGIAFSKCMRANGVPNFPDPGSGSGGGVQISASQTAGSGKTLTVNGVPVSAPAFQAANQKCQKDLPRGGPALSSAQLNKLRAGALAMAKCMRAHGVPNFPDPVVSAGPGGKGVNVRIGGGGPGSGINPTSPAFQSAQKTCQPLMGGPGLPTKAISGGAGASAG